MLKRTTFCLVSILFFFVNSNSFADNSFAFVSTLGDKAGGGAVGFYDDSQSIFSSIFSTGPYSVNVNVQAKDSSYFWLLDFASTTNSNAPLSKGNYPNASRFNTSTNPAMDVRNIFGYGQCGEISGEFKILDISFNKDNVLQTLALDFTQYCDDKNKAHPLYGSVRYHSSIPNDLEAYISSQKNSG